jgi:cobalamin biosynthesis Mg chelatase CobN
MPKWLSLGQEEMILTPAQEAAYVLTPGQTLPADVKTSMDNLAHTATVTVTSSEATPTSSTTSAAGADSTSDESSETSGSTKSSGLGTGAIVGIVIGGVALLALAGGLFWWVLINLILLYEIILTVMQ